MLWRYEFISESEFIPAVGLHFFKLRMQPAENHFQHIVSSDVRITPQGKVNIATDGFGNIVMYGNYNHEHSHFQVISEGIADCGEYFLPEETPQDFYLYPTPLTVCNEDIRKYFEGLTALEIMHAVHSMMHYERFVTDNATTAIEAFERRKGVCQDYAHIMITACRSQGMHARYVNGLVEGEGETHAWVEVHSNGQWLGCDPTYNRLIHSGYLKIAHGRDANDCPVNRGRFYQWTMETMSVRSKVTTTDNK